MEQPVGTIWPLHHPVSSALLIQDSSAIEHSLVLIKTHSIAACCHCLELQQAPGHALGTAQHPLTAPLPRALGGTRAGRNEVTILGGCRGAVGWAKGSARCWVPCMCVQGAGGIHDVRTRWSSFGAGLIIVCLNYFKILEFLS